MLVSSILIGFGFRDGIDFFQTPSQVVSNPFEIGKTFRVGGLVKEGSLKRREGKTIEFAITDTKNSVIVNYSGILPDLFEEGQGVIVLGSLSSKTKFVATEIYAKHDESYMPREVIESLKEQGVFVDPKN